MSFADETETNYIYIYLIYSLSSGLRRVADHVFLQTPFFKSKEKLQSSLPFLAFLTG